MGQVICSCENPKFANLNRPNCVIEQRAIAFPIIVPRYQADGTTRNTLDVSSPTIGQDIKDLLLASVDVESRIYPFSRCENVTFERTDTVYETAASTRKYKIPGVGGVRTMRVENWAKNAVHQILRELKNIGCTDVDVFLVDTAGSLWGIKDDINSNIMRGYAVATETFDAFKEYATDTTVQKIMTSWDFDNEECEENSYAITAGELGYKATTLRGNISGYTESSALTTTTALVEVYTGFGSADERGKVVGLLDANFVLTNNGVPVAATAVEGADGEYTLTFAAQVLNDVIDVQVINAVGYDVEGSTFLAL
jgi:hypothetical protein